MENIEDKMSALEIFEKFAIAHSGATEEGNYKKANASYDKIVEAADYLREHAELDDLYDFLAHESIGVRIWSASYLLQTMHKNYAEKVLEKIASNGGIHSLDAKTVLEEWRKGRLVL